MYQLLEIICVYTEKELIEILKYYKDSTHFERNDFVACKTSDSDIVADYVRITKIDKIYDSAISAGAIGGKLLGAGGGGHFLFLADPDNRIHVENELQKSGCKIVKFNFDENGLQSWKIDNGRVLP